MKKTYKQRLAEMISACFAGNTAAFAAHFGITPHSVYNANRRSDDLSAMLRGIVIAYELGREKKS